MSEDQLDAVSSSKIPSMQLHGLSELEVVEAFGRKPARRYTSESAPDDYYVPGYAQPDRGIDGSVLIFMFGEPLWFFWLEFKVCYVWLDPQGLVEDYYIGGS